MQEARFCAGAALLHQTVSGMSQNETLDYFEEKVLFPVVLEEIFRLHLSIGMTLGFTIHLMLYKSPTSEGS